MREEIIQTICGAKTADGTACQRRVKPGSGPCAYHASTVGQKIRAWARNSTLIFVFTVVGLIITVAAFSGWFYDEFLKNAPAPIHTPIPSVYKLSDERRGRFLRFLASQTTPHDKLRIGCTTWSEASCVAAGEFLILFSSAGWQIEGNRVFRLEPQIPIVGVAITTRTPANEPKDPLPPYQGRWRQMDDSHKAIYSAFHSLDIPVQGGTDDTLQEGTLGIYFGSEPK
jgi:hypothetical protein